MKIPKTIISPLQFWFEDREKRRLDIVLFINGIPICDFQLKSPTVYEAEEEAFEQVRIYNDALPELFKYLQFYAASEETFLRPYMEI